MNVANRIRITLQRQILMVESAVQSGMRTDPVSTKEHLYCGFGEPHIYLLLDVLKGNRVIHALHRNTVIRAYRCNFSGCKFKGPGR